MAVVPDAKVDLRIRLRPQVAYVSDKDGWRAETSLEGSVEITRQ